MTVLHVVRDTESYADVKAERDAALGALAELTAQSGAAPFGPTATEPQRSKRQREDDALAYWHGRLAVHSDETKRWQDIAGRAER